MSADVPLNLTKERNKENSAVATIRAMPSIAMNRKSSDIQEYIRLNAAEAVQKTIKKEAPAAVPLYLTKGAIEKNRKKKGTDAVPRNIRKVTASELKRLKTEHTDKASQQETDPTTSRPSRKRKPTIKQEEQEGKWILESRAFATDVIENVISSLYNNLTDLSSAELRSLRKVRLVWKQKYELDERKPEWNQSQLSPAPPKRKCKTTAKKTPKPGSIPAKERDIHDEEEDEEDLANYYHWDDLPDDEIVENQISVPPLLEKYSCRRFDIKMPAFAMKRNLIQPLFSLELLDRIMEPPQVEGTKILQQVVDEMLRQYQQGPRPHT
ncbi:GL14842 [Drosophila persimilis]|uniref:GL14842 n=2 Tax=Drosophila persimilis TaxID=7234 RepID=B4H0I6_DROPE|nr:GL14842 [Drosophila persimilis]